jgi:hypothetical protein
MSAFNSREIEQIRLDAEAWRNTSRWRGFWSRDNIMVAIQKHDKNLTDCFNFFLVSNQNPI